MAIRTTVQSGLWSAPATWDTGVPVDGDSAVISAGHIVEFDVDQSGFASGLAGVTLNGTLRASTTPGAYVLKLAGHMTPGANGRLEAGTEADPYPATCTFEIQVNGNYYAVNGGTNAVALYGQQPQYPTALLAAGASAGQTVLTLDTDVTGDWMVGDIVYVCNVNMTRNEEQHTIAAVGAGTVTLASGMASAKLAGSVVALSTRNVRMVGPGTGAGRGIVNSNGAALAGVEIRAFQYGVLSGSNHVLTGCTLSGNSCGAYSGSNHVLTGCTLSGNTYGAYYGSNHVLTGCTLSGNSCGAYYGSNHVLTGCTLSGNTYGVDSGSNHALTGCTLSGNTYGVREGSNRLFDCNFAGNANDLYETSGTAYRCTLASTTQHAGYSALINAPFVARDMDSVAGAIRAWMAGGRIAPNDVELPPSGGHTLSHHLFFERATTAEPISIDTPVWLDLDTVLLEPGASVTLSAWLKQSATGMAEPVRLQLIDPAHDPLIESAASVLAEEAIAETTDWQHVELVYTPPTTQQATIRIYARNDSGEGWVSGIEPGQAIEVEVPVLAEGTLVISTEADNELSAVVVEDILVVTVED